MTGAELEQCVKRLSLSYSEMARRIGTTPRNFERIRKKRTIPLLYENAIRHVEAQHTPRTTCAMAYAQTAQHLSRLQHNVEQLHASILKLPLPP